MPPVYYINLDARPDRRDHMERQFAALGLAAIRMPAVKVSDLPTEEVARYCDTSAVRFLTRSELACWKSHISCWRAFLDAGEPWALVHEDDAVLSSRLPAFVESLMSSDLASQIDLLQLETATRRTRVLPPIGEVPPGIALRPFRSVSWGTAGYLISAGAARTLLALPDLISRSIDDTLFRPYNKPASDLRLVLAEPALCVQANRLEASGIAVGNVAGSDRVSSSVSVSIRLRRAWASVRRSAANAVDHLLNLPKGVRYTIIPFETSERLIVGKLHTDEGKEITD